MTYEVTIRETLSRTITVDANSKMQALDIVKDKYNRSEIVLDCDDYNKTDYLIKQVI
jgi:hypothetical protein